MWVERKLHVGNPYWNKDLVRAGPAKLPTTKNTVRTQQALLTEAERWAELRAVIIAPFETKGTFPNVIRLMDRRPKLPIFTIDKSYETLAAESHQMPPLGVMNDWENGGALAGQAAVWHLGDFLKIENPQILLVCGSEGSADRIRTFKACVTRELDNVRILAELQGKFQKGAARAVVSEYFERNSEDKRTMPQLIFCANDEMAIGVREAVLKWENVRKKKSGIVIIGYDGIESVTELMDAGDPYILNTVDVDIRCQVRTLAGMVVNHLLNIDTNPTKRVIRTPGHLARPFDKQRGFTSEWRKGLQEAGFDFKPSK